MRKIYSSLILAVASIFGVNSQAAETVYPVNGINYVILTEQTVMAQEPVDGETLTGVLELPANVKINNKDYTLTAIDALAFKDCTGITSVKLPATIDSIGYQAFNGCTNMTSINLEDTKLHNLEVSTFLYCRSLRTITIPATVTEIGSNPFMETLSLTKITVAPGNINYVDVDGVLFTKSKKTLLAYPVGKSTDYVIPDGVDTIATMAFCQARTVKNVSFPESVKIIENNAFMRCDSLQLIKLPPYIEKIGASAFSECKKAAGEIILPNTLKTLLSKAFYYTQITKLDIPGTIKTIPDWVAQYCVKLRYVTLHEGTTKIGNSCFHTCQLTEFVIPNSVTSVGTSCFEGSTYLKKVEIGEGVKTIGIRAFYNLKLINSVICKGATPPTISGTATYPAFTADVLANAELQVPESALNDYKGADVWKDFTKITGVSGVNEVEVEGVEVVNTADGIYVNSPSGMMVEVYTISGAKVYTGEGGKIALSAKGVYIVRVGGKVFKTIF